ncbi:restriction endonuclease, partial [Myxococcota bacterium]|nr:restriction endonuclease [Myxococcota bacterium]
AELRAYVVVEVARAYGLDVDGLARILEDFPLLDRGQPPLDAEARSTITRDLVLSTAARRAGADDRWAERVARARALGAIAYVPEELARAAKARR